MTNKLTIMVVALAATLAGAAELLIGGAEVSITPDRPISLAGQFHQRISKGVESPCMVNVIAIEAREGDKVVDHAVLVSVDLGIVSSVIKPFREYMADKLPEGLELRKIFLGAIHTHTAPTTSQSAFPDYGDAMQPKEYVPFFCERLGEAVIKAWEARKPGKVAWGMGHAVVAQNRRSTFRNGTAVMYGNINRQDYMGLEGWEDHALDVLCFTDVRDRLVAVSLAVPCPAQCVESQYYVSSDYMGEVRQQLRAKFNDKNIAVAGFIAPAGDMSPHRRLRVKAEERMLKLRGTSEKAELGRRVVESFADIWSVIQKDLRTDVPFAYEIKDIKLPYRKITEAEYNSNKRDAANLDKQIDNPETKPNDRSTAVTLKGWHQRVVDRYEAQKNKELEGDVELHVLRIGDLAIASNPFELFQDYAMRIHARTPAPQTMLIQLANPIDVAAYLPSERGVSGGGYSAVPQSGPIGPEGGQVLVEKTLEAIGEMFKK